MIHLGLTYCYLQIVTLLNLHICEEVLWAGRSMNSLQKLRRDRCSKFYKDIHAWWNDVGTKI